MRALPYTHYAAHWVRARDAYANYCVIIIVRGGTVEADVGCGDNDDDHRCNHELCSVRRATRQIIESLRQCRFVSATDLWWSMLALVEFVAPVNGTQLNVCLYGSNI